LSFIQEEISMSIQRWLVLVILIGLVGVIGLALVHVRSENRLPASVSEKTAGVTVAPQLDQPRALDPVQNIRFTVYENGIAPRELKVRKGLVSITIEDRTRKSEGLAIEREVGNGRSRVGQVKRFQDFWRGRDQVRVTPGTYVVFDTSNPANRARLVVVP
jgi:hypothetical protein